MNDTFPLILASRSPRRAELLTRMGFDFQIRVRDVNEDAVQISDPEALVLELSSQKAEAVRPDVSRGLIVGADTVVCLNGQILGKPRDETDARRMLTQLSGKTHTVFTGFTLLQTPGSRRESGIERTDVTFRHLEAWEIDAYVATGGPLDKAGAYGIQDRSGLFVDQIAGCYYNVVGFPLTRFFQALVRMVGETQVRRMWQ